MFSLQLLGPPIIQWNEESIGRFRSAKSLALLAYLAIERRNKHGRSSLITLFWPDLPENNARQNLSQILTRLRDTLALNGLWYWAQYLWAAGQHDQAVALLG